MDNTNPKKKRILTIVIIVLVLLFLVGIIFIFVYKPAEKQTIITENPPLDQTTEPESQAAPVVTEIPANAKPLITYEFDENKEETREMTAEDLKQIAFSFAERFGSYSNQANYGNIEDLKTYMTSDMRDWADKFIAEQRNQEYVGYYYGITTKALVGKVNTFNATDAEILISTRRQEVKDTTTNVFDQDITIGFIKVGDDWKVDSAYWQ